MTTFTDGPAEGKTLTLGRSPLFLRVVIAPGNKIDALDQLADTPAPEEEIQVYRCLTANPTTMHIDGRDPTTGKRFGRWLSCAEYRLHHSQPDEETARDTDRWRAWCADQASKL